MSEKTKMPLQEAIALLLVAADLLWAMSRDKETDSDPMAVNQEIYDFSRKHGFGVLPEGDWDYVI